MTDTLQQLDSDDGLNIIRIDGTTINPMEPAFDKINQNFTALVDGTTQQKPGSGSGTTVSMWVGTQGEYDTLTPDSDTLYFIVENTSTDSDGTPVDSDGTYNDSDGMSTDSDGTPTDSDGTPTDSDGTPTDSDGTPVDDGSVRDVSSLFSETIPTIAGNSPAEGREWIVNLGWQPRQTRFTIDFETDGTLNAYASRDGHAVELRTLVWSGSWLDRGIQTYDDGPAGDFTEYAERFAISSTLKSINGIEVPFDANPNSPVESHTSNGVTVDRRKTTYSFVGDNYATNISDPVERMNLGQISFNVFETSMTEVSEATAYSGSMELEIIMQPPTGDAFGTYSPASIVRQTITLEYDFPVGTRVSEEYPTVVAVAQDGFTQDDPDHYTGIWTYSPTIIEDPEDNSLIVRPLFIEAPSADDGTQHTVRFMAYGNDRSDDYHTHYYPVTYTFGSDWQITGPVTLNYGEEMLNTLTAPSTGNYEVNVSSTHSGGTYDWLNAPIGVRYSDEYRGPNGGILPEFNAEDSGNIFDH